jgi:hypothetical protein
MEDREAPPRVLTIGDIARGLYRSTGRESGNKWYTASIDTKVRRAGESIANVVQRAMDPVVDALVLQLKVVDALAVKLEQGGRLPTTQLPEDEELLLVAWAGARLGIPCWRQILRADRRRYFCAGGRNHEFRPSELRTALRLASHPIPEACREGDYLEEVLASSLDALTLDALDGLSPATVRVAAPAVQGILLPAIETLRARAAAQVRMLDVLHPSKQPPRVIMAILLSLAGPATRRRSHSRDDELELCHELWVKNSRGDIDWHDFLTRDLSDAEYRRLLTSDDPLVLAKPRQGLPQNGIDVEMGVRRALSWIWDGLRPHVVTAVLGEDHCESHEDWPESKDTERRALLRFQRFVSVIELYKRKWISPGILLEIAQLRTTEIGRELTWPQLLGHIRELGSSTTRNSLTRQDRPSDAAIIREYHRKCEIANSAASVRVQDPTGDAPGSLAPGSPVYIHRKADEGLSTLIREARDPVIVLSGPRKIGKTTLAKHVAVALGEPHLYLSFQNLDGAGEVRTARELERLLLAGIEREKARSGVSEPRIVLLDEVDLIPRKLHFDLVRYLRACCRVSVLVSVFPLEGAGELPTVLVPPFDRAQIKDLVNVYGPHPLLAGEGDVSRLLHELGGNPYLIHLAVHTITNNGQSLLTFFHHVFEDRNPLASFLRGLAGERAAEPELFAGLLALLQGRAVEAPRVREGLVRHGLAVADGNGHLVPLCGIYKWLFPELDEPSPASSAT